MNYPTRPQNPNGWQIAGDLITRGSQAYGDFAESQNRLQLLMQEAAQKKAAAEILRMKAEREAAAEAQKAEWEASDRTTKEKQRQESERVRAEIAAGKTVPGKSVGGVVGPDEVVPYPADEANRMLFKSGDLTGKEYSATIDPTKSIEGQKEIFGFKDAANATREERRQKWLQAQNEYNQGRMDYRALMAIKAQMEKAEAPKDLAAPVVDKLTALGGKRDNVAFMVESFKDEYSGLGEGFMNKVGEYTGTNEDQVLWWKGYQDFVNQVRNDLFGASLTPGEAAEFRKAVISPNANPRIARAYLNKQLKLVNDAVERARRTAKAGRKVNTEQVDAALGGGKKKTAADYLAEEGL